MRVLLDTNILIHREANSVVRADIGLLFRWLDRLKIEKCVHPGSAVEISKHADARVVRSFNIKLTSYNVLKTTPPDSSEITTIRVADKTDNDKLDTSLLAEIAAGRVDALVTEDRGIHRKAQTLHLSGSVFTIDSFLEKVTAENPALADYKVLAVRKAYFGNVNLKDSFFDSFRRDYLEFDRWFNRKADEVAYVCTSDSGAIVAFLYLKVEGDSEDYSEIKPSFARASRLKIGTFKVLQTGYKLGERFLKVVFDNAYRNKVDEIYVTAFCNTDEQKSLVHLLEDWGFCESGTKSSSSGLERVWVRDFRPMIDLSDPRRTYPYMSRKARKFIVPIWPQYHTELLPDSILRTESADNFVENKPNRNAISKVYVSRSIERDLKTGDIVAFYRTGSGTGPAHHTSVVTTIGVIQDVVANLTTSSEFIKACRKRSVFSDEELLAQWNWKPKHRPFVVNFLYAHSFKRRPNLSQLKESGVIATQPRGFELLTDSSFNKLLELANVDQRFIID